MVDLIYWAPRRRIFKGWRGRLLRVSRPVRNFGDLLSPLVIDGMTRRLEISSDAGGSRRLLAIGSILHLARDGDVVWGSGINGKVDSSALQFSDLDVRAVRGPLTAGLLRERGLDVPAVYGDPALLMPLLYPALRDWSAEKRFEVTVVPNLNDQRLYDPDDTRVLDVRLPAWHCIERIARSETVVGSSLHGLVVAESLGIPARGIRSPVEHPFKYDDYYSGTGRASVELAPDARAAVAMGGAPALRWSSQPLLDAFPAELWE